MPKPLILVALIALASASTGCGTSNKAPRGHGLDVVAAENVWGSIAAQLGGSKVHVTSAITSPAIDPHAYEPNAADGRAFAGAQLVIVNGIGYDPWAAKLVAANPVGGRIVLTVGDLVGIKPGGNPHRWYSPANVHQVIGAIARDYARLDPKDAAYFERQKVWFETRALARYTHLLATIKRRYAQVPVGASESIFSPLAKALGLALLTPYSFLKAISEGTEPTAADITTIDNQIARRQVKLWVFNSQNSTPDVQRLTDAARKRGLPITTVTETLQPASARFQDWQSNQLQALLAALARATGR